MSWFDTPPLTPFAGTSRRTFAWSSWKGVGIAVPPSYLEPWAERFPRLFKFAAKIDPLLGQCPGFRALADHVVVVLERVEV